MPAVAAHPIAQPIMGSTTAEQPTPRALSSLKSRCQDEDDVA